MAEPTTTVGIEDEAQERRAFTGVLGKFITLLAIAFSVFEIAALQFWVIDLWVFEAVVLAIVMVLGYLTIPASPKYRGRVTVVDVVLLVAGVVPCIYVIVDLERLQWTYGSTVEPMDIVMGSLLIVSLLELTRRAFGWSMPIVSLVFLAYGLFGNLLPPSLFGHTGLKPGNVIGFMIGDMAIFGSVMSVMVQTIFLFMLFSAFLQISGAGEFFVNLANAVAGRWRGGAAKVSVFSSSLFGTISGNSVANVAVDGGITIPLMMKTGFRPQFAAAVEATASAGGQIMPPIMGAGAFIMAELLNVSYSQVIVAAALPAILYYVGLYCMVDLEAVRQGIRGVPSRDTLGRVWAALRDGGHLLIPVFVLLHQTVIVGTSMQRAGFYSVITVIVVSWFRRRSRIGWTRFIDGLRDAAMISVGIAAVCASAGIIVGIVAMTGVGVKFGSIVVGLSQGNLFFTLVLTAVICLFLGTGLPTTASYIITAAVGVPALLKLGADPLGAHLFVFYFAAISTITPPVAGAVYTACGFSGSPVMATGWTATRLGISAYIVPFLFVYHPVLLWKGGWLEITQATVSAIVGVAAVSMALIGTSYIGAIRWNLLQRTLFFGAFFALITPGTFSDLLGLSAIVVTVLTHPQSWQRLLRAMGRKADVAIAVETPDGRA